MSSKDQSSAEAKQCAETKEYTEAKECAETNEFVETEECAENAEAKEYAKAENAEAKECAKAECAEAQECAEVEECSTAESVASSNATELVNADKELVDADKSCPVVTPPVPRYDTEIEREGSDLEVCIKKGCSDLYVKDDNRSWVPLHSVLN